MPKLKPSDMEMKQRSVRAVIAEAKELQGYNDKEIARLVQMPISTYQQRIREPQNFRLEELWKLSAVLKLEMDGLLQIIVGRQEMDARLKKLVTVLKQRGEEADAASRL